MPMITAKVDDRGRPVHPSDYVHVFYLLPAEGEPVKLATHATDKGHVTRDTDRWEIAEAELVHAFENNRWEPGTYRVVTFANYSSMELGRIERPMPLPPGYTRLGKSPRNGLPARTFVRTMLDWYPGSTFEMLAEHVEVFAQHWHAHISTAELTRLTGYTLPDGHPRPSHPNAEITEANA